MRTRHPPPITIAIAANVQATVFISASVQHAADAARPFAADPPYRLAYVRHDCLVVLPVVDELGGHCEASYFPEASHRVDQLDLTHRVPFFRRLRRCGQYVVFYRGH